MVNSSQAQTIGAAALAIAQIIGVIDEAGKIRVLIIDPHRQNMDRALEAARGGCVVLSL